MERPELINKVKSKLDEISSSSDLLINVGVEDNSPLDEIIGSLLDESVRDLLLKGPIHRLPIKKLEASPKANTEDVNMGSVELPADFIRLVSFRMKGWKRSVTSPALEGDEIALRQSNAFLRGGVAKPVGVIRTSPTGLVMDYYSILAEEAHVIETLDYIASCTPEEILNEQMIDALTWICTCKVLGVLRQDVAAENASKTAQSLMI